MQKNAVHFLSSILQNSINHLEILTVISAYQIHSFYQRNCTVEKKILYHTLHIIFDLDCVSNFLLVNRNQENRLGTCLLESDVIMQKNLINKI
jgi:hypothetical protein